MSQVVPPFPEPAFPHLMCFILSSFSSHCVTHTRTKVAFVSCDFGCRVIKYVNFQRMNFRFGIKNIYIWDVMEADWGKVGCIKCMHLTMRYICASYLLVTLSPQRNVSWDELGQLLQFYVKKIHPAARRKNYH